MPSVLAARVDWQVGQAQSLQASGHMARLLTLKGHSTHVWCTQATQLASCLTLWTISRSFVCIPLSGCTPLVTDTQRLCPLCTDAWCTCCGPQLHA